MLEDVAHGIHAKTNIGTYFIHHAHQVEFSREALGKGAGLPPARAFYALEVLLCNVGKEAGLGTTLLVDCGVGVLAARGRVMKFTFVQVCVLVCALLVRVYFPF